MEKGDSERWEERGGEEGEEDESERERERDEFIDNQQVTYGWVTPLLGTRDPACGSNHYSPLSVGLAARLASTGGQRHPAASTSSLATATMSMPPCARQAC